MRRYGRKEAASLTTVFAPLQAQFYKTFTRPIAKVLLMAVLTYQVAYYGWTRLETDELREEADGASPNLRQ